MTEEDLQADDNVWNDKKTDDFMRYIKYDYFIVVYIFTQLLSGLIWGYSPGNEHLIIDQYGPRDFWPTGYCILTIVIVRINGLIYLFMKLRVGATFDE